MAAVRRACAPPAALNDPGRREPNMDSQPGTAQPPAEWLALPWLRGAERPMERRPREDAGRDVIQIEVDLGQHAHILSGPLVDRDHRLDAKLDVAAEPDDPRVDGTRRMPGERPIHGRLQGQLDERDHPIEGSRQADVPHERLQVLQTVLHRETPLEDGGIELVMHLDVAVIVERGDLVVRPAGYRPAKDTGYRYGLQPFHGVRQITKALAEVKLGYVVVEGLRNLRTARAADLGCEPCREQQLMGRILEVDVFEIDLHVL